MDESEFQTDSMYEMDAPKRVDFDATDISPNESIFERKIVGVKTSHHDSMVFKSPSSVFRDIGNVTPKVSGSSSKVKDRLSQSSSTPLLNRRVTRSASKTANDTLTPVTKHEGILDEQPLWSDAVKPAAPITRPVVLPQEILLSSPKLTQTNADKANITTVKQLTHKRHSASSTQSISQASQSKKSAYSQSQNVRSGGAPAQTTALTGIPFKGKYSPSKTLRMRTRSQEVAVTNNKPLSHSRKNEVRVRTSSASSTLRTRSASPTNSIRVETVSSSLGETRALSSSLSRLMRTTESARLKKQEPSSASKRKGCAAGVKPPKVPKYTIPKSPSFLRQPRRRLTPVKSSEELELEKIAKEKKEMSSLRKMNEVVLRNTSSSGKKPGLPPIGSSHKMSTRSETQSKARRTIYDVIDDKRRSTDSSVRKLSDSLSKKEPRRDVYTRPAVTKPLSPKFETAKRERPAKIPTAEEREAMELEKLKQHQFKATPLDRKVLEAPSATAVQREQVQVTQPLPIRFATEERIAKHATKAAAQEIPTQGIKAQPAPKLAPVFKPKLEHKSTNAEPFTFESKDEAVKRRRAEMIKRVEEEERKLREFKANPLPPSPAPLPPRQVVATTVPEPFHLKIDERGQQQQEKFKRRVQAENARMLEATMVHAKPADVLKKAPFVPKKEAAKCTEPLDIKLNLTKRAEERKEYQLQKQEAECEVAAIEEEVRKREEHRERQELRRLRKETIVKPEPIKHYKPLEIKKSDKPLTLAKSPRFSKR